MPSSTPSSAKSRNNGNRKNGGASAFSTNSSAEPAKGTSPSSSQSAQQPTYEQIAQRAYEIYERDGRRDGSELENWLKAEAELCGPDTRRS
jgi:hypothetical protein